MIWCVCVCAYAHAHKSPIYMNSFVTDSCTFEKTFEAQFIYLGSLISANNDINRNFKIHYLFIKYYRKKHFEIHSELLSRSCKVKNI